MNDLLRPSLYHAHHQIIPVDQVNCGDITYQVAGPVCENSDVLGCITTSAPNEGNVLAILSAGAYGFVMSSNYNSRPRAAEVMVDNHAMHLVRSRESIADCFAHEMVLP